MTPPRTPVRLPHPCITPFPNPSALTVVWRRETTLQSDRGFITPAVRPAVAGALWVPVQDKYRLETQLPHISHQSALHGSQPCPPTNTLTSLEPTKLPPDWETG